MVTIIQGVRQKSPFAAGIENAANAFFGPDRMNAQLRRAQLERAQQDLALKDREARAATEFANTLPQNFGNAVLGGVSGSDLQRFNLLDQATRAAQEGGDLLGNRNVNAAQLGAGLAAGSTGLGFREGETNQTQRTLGAANIGAAASTRNAQIAAAQRAAAAEAALGEQRRQFNQMPVEAIVDGAPAFRPRADVFVPGVAPIQSLPEAQGTAFQNNFGNADELSLRQAAGIGLAPSATEAQGQALQRALPQFDPVSLSTGQVNEAFGFGQPEVKRFQVPGGQAFISTDGGLTDADTGERIPANAVEIGKLSAASRTDAGLGPTTTTATNVFGAADTLRNMGDLSGALRQVAQNNPGIFGLEGQIRQLGQGTANLFTSMDALLGEPGAVEKNIGLAQQALSDPSQADASARFALNGLFDPALDEVDQLYQLMLFQGAAALAGQEGRALTDADVKRMQSVFPDPKGLFMSQERFLSALSNVDRIVGARQQANIEQQGGQFNPSSAASAPGITQEITIDINGNIVP